MAQVRIMFWKDIPYAVRATEGQGRASRQLPAAFQEAVDEAAMVEGATDAAGYQAGFAWGAPEERAGTVDEIADAVVAEIVAAYPPARLKELTRRGK
jgi:hypothetical protein